MYSFEVEEFEQMGYFRLSNYNLAQGYKDKLEKAVNEKLVLVRGLPPFGSSMVICRPELVPKFRKELESFIEQLKSYLDQAEKGLQEIENES